MSRKTKLIGVIALLLMSAAVSYADVALPDILSDGMVLQRGRPVPVWGKADPGERVSVSFAGQTRSTTANSEGRWRVSLDAMNGSTVPATMVITGHNRIEVQNVLVGEVWLCAGQSNMQLTLDQTNDGAAAIAAAAHPMLVLFNVSREVAFKRSSGPLGEWQASSPESVKAFSAACYYFGVDLQKELNVPVGLINSSYGGSQAEAWTPQEYLLASDDLRPCVERTRIWDAERPRVKTEFDEEMTQWRAAVKETRATGARPPREPRAPDALRPYRIAASIYNGMIEPLIPFSIRGALWYQGESNEERAQQYGILLPTMIRAWRETWGQGDFPVGIVQLPNYRMPQPDPTDEAWSFVREAQRRTALTTPKTGLIVTIDIGEANNIHPKDKIDVGKRMYLWALADVYGRKIVSSGPMFDKAKVKGAKIVLTFKEVGHGLKLRDGDNTLGAFVIAGQDHHWYWADARIKGKNQVEIWSDKVPQPQAVRYAFNNNPEHASLTNDSGLPAAPFRTDDWPGPTDGKR